MASKPRNDDCVLAVSVGNTVTKVGCFRDTELLAHWKLTTPAFITVDEASETLMRFMRLKGVASSSEPPYAAGAIVASVVPALSDAWLKAASSCSFGRVFAVGPGLKTGLQMRLNDPSEAGADRIADAVAAKQLLASPCISIDLGTTTNFGVIAQDGSFAGGIIAPGLRLSLAALSQTAAQLCQIDLKAPPRIIGKSTREAMQSGAVMGEVARIDGLIDMVQTELGCSAPIVMSGSDAAALSALSRYDITVEEHLTLKGLALLYAMNARR